MKVIDLLNKIANGEEVPKKIRIDHWCYKFEWVEHLDNYYDKSADVDLMSVLSMNKEELNYGVKIIEEEIEIIEENKPIQLLKTYSGENYSDDKELIVNKINQIIDTVNELKERE